MDKDARNAIERATQQARKVLESDFASQLEGDFDVRCDGVVAARAGDHLSPRQAFQRERILAAIEHKRAAGMSADEAAQDYLRDAAFTTLNRFVALKMLEARDLVQECITKGEQSSGYREFCGMAPGIQLLPASAGYRLYIESLFDELSTEVKVLFDRCDASSVLWPRRSTFEQLLEILNASDLCAVWGQDETIGWVYQFFNGQDERRKMREESQAPRNSRELAVRNQFFTPRYVVQFLTDNTLGRIWYEMRETRTVLADGCAYLVTNPDDELARRPKKDPRDIRVLDPACGSGHFLLYAFDLLLAIYTEAHSDPTSPKSEATGNTLAEDYPSTDALRRAIPSLILAHNLCGVDIDPRCAQIAQLALWMRAQRAYRDFGIGRWERTQIRRSNIVVAEPLIADEAIAAEFAAALGDRALVEDFMSLVRVLNLAGDLGLLLRVECLVDPAAEASGGGGLFAPDQERIHSALERFIDHAAGRHDARRRIFVDDASRGFGLLGIAQQQFDAVLMNPPFGQPTARGFRYIRDQYVGSHADIYAAFVRRAAELAPHGFVGAITSRSFLLSPRLEVFRRAVFLPRVQLLLDLGLGVMDDALVESAAYVLGSGGRDAFLALDGRDLRRVSAGLPDSLKVERDWRRCNRSVFSALPQQKVLYSLPPEVVSLMSQGPSFEPDIGTAREGMKSFDNDRFVRLWWEVPREKIGVDAKWHWFAKGGEFGFLFGTPHLVLNWNDNGSELQAVNLALNGSTAQVRQASNYWYRSGVTYSKRSSKGFSARALPSGVIFSSNGPAVLSLDESVSPVFLLGWINSRPVRALLHLQSNACDYSTGAIKRLPWRHLRGQSVADLESDTAKLLCALAQDASADETSILFNGLGETPRVPDRDSLTEAILGRWDVAVATAFGLRDLRWADDLLEGADSEDSHSTELSDESEETESSYDRRESVTHLQRTLSWLVGVAFSRFIDYPSMGTAASASVPDPFAALPSAPPAVRVSKRANTDGLGILVDDEGHPLDFAARVQDAADRARLEVPVGLRSWLADEFFQLHINMYSRSRRVAPIYWQLATSSSRYSVWLYVHELGPDTLFRVQNDFVAPKLAYEQRRLESLASEARDGASPVLRKRIADQEAFVDELRAFLDEVKRVAPLWDPSLDDGVVINFAPLWRLVSHKSWQKALKCSWDALAKGQHDWSQLAMRLWPERVVQKCVEDRSLAIAHGLDDLFWIKGAEGKWSTRKVPIARIDEAVKHRTSQAVKSALKSLIDAPIAIGNSAGRRSGGRRKSKADFEGGVG